MAGRGSSPKKREAKAEILTILIVVAVILLAVSILGPRIPHPLPYRVICGSNMSGLTKAITVYANDHKTVPPANEWCDILILRDYATVKQFVCRQSDAIVGESSYAINENVAGRQLAQFDPNVVLLFETDFGIDSRGRLELLKNRAWYSTWPRGQPDTKVYKNRWNQAGGPAILTTMHHYTKEHGGACNVALVSGRVYIVRTKDLNKLKWK